MNIGDSRAMKRLSYVTMIFLPASFVAVGCFPFFHWYRSSDAGVSYIGRFWDECNGAESRNLRHASSLCRSHSTPHSSDDMGGSRFPELVQRTR